MGREDRIGGKLRLVGAVGAADSDEDSVKDEEERVKAAVGRVDLVEELSSENFNSILVTQLQRDTE